MRLRELLVCALSALVIAGAPAPASGAAATSAAEYKLAALPPLPGDDQAIANDVNNAGVVVGTSYSSAPSRSHAVVWRRDARGSYVAEALPPLAGNDESNADGINNAGWIVGGSITHGVPASGSAVLWRGGLPTALPSTSTTAQIADKGWIAAGAWLWHDGALTNIVPSFAALGSFWTGGFAVTGINSIGVVGGVMSTVFGPYVFRLSPGGSVEYWPGLFPSSTNLVGGLNRSGQIVGTSTNRGRGATIGRAGHAFVWGATTTDLGTLAPANPQSGSGAHSTNDAGVVVGNAFDENDTYRHAVRWRDGQIADLNALAGTDLPLRLTDAQAVSNTGYIAGLAVALPADPYGDSPDAAFVLAPCGDPAQKDWNGDGNPDDDGDGLPDCWEVRGVDTNGNGTSNLDLAAMGADPEHKDVFVQLDHMAGHAISNDALRIVVDAFASAPVDNPDGTPGVTLHVDNGPESLMDPSNGNAWGDLSKASTLPHAATLGSFTASGEYDWTAFQALKDSYFPASRRAAFHYVISAHDFDAANQYSGISRNDDTTTATFNAGAGDVIVSLGGACDSDPCSPRLGVQAGTFMHELGHNLGLHHGGTDDDNYKPNYLSIMNYLFQFSGLRVGDTFRYDYSRYGASAIGPLDENNKLDETKGLSPADPALRNFWTFWYCPSGAPRGSSAAAAIDWNCNSVKDAAPVGVDVNNDGKATTLAPAEDWHRLVFTGGGIGSLGAPLLPMATKLIEPPISELLADAHLVDPVDFAGLSDTTAPTSRADASPAPNPSGWNADSVTVTLSASDDPGGSGVQAVHYSTGGAETIVAGSAGTVTVAAEGATTLSYYAVDLAGNKEAAHTLTIRIDRTPPGVACASADGAWHATNVSLACTARDALSGLADPATSAFTLATTVAADAETANAQTDALRVCDVAGNCVSAGPVGGIRVDRKAPSVAISSPAGTYTIGQAVLASYGCGDGGAGVAFCTGPVANGRAIDTGAVGSRSFAVSAADAVGNTTSTSSSYRITYGICLLYDAAQVRKAGSTIPVRLSLCNAVGLAVGAPFVGVRAVGVDGGLANDAGNANAGGAFRYEAGAYVFNLSTKGLAAGPHILAIAVAGDPLTHALAFTLR